MSFSPEALLSKEVRDKCVARLQELAGFRNKNKSAKDRAAVLLPLCVRNGEVHLLYTLRSRNLKSHSGQVSFPGGKMEENEKVTETALRETFEEIGVPSNSIDVWCEMPSVIGYDRKMVITPVIGVIKDFNFNKLNPNTAEVEEVFTVPMEAFCDKRNHAHFMYGEEKDIMLPVYLYGKHRIWGITAYMTHFFLQSFLPGELYDIDFTRKTFTLNELLASKL